MIPAPAHADRGPRRARVLALALAALALAACEQANVDPKAERKVGSNRPDVIEEAGLGDVVLQVADPSVAVDYYRRKVNEDPANANYKRNLAKALVRAKQYAEAQLVFKTLDDDNALDSEDHVEYALALARLDQWDDARSQLNKISIGYDSARRRRMEAILADHDQDWVGADAAYSRARELTTRPAEVLNDWGYSKMARGDIPEAKKLFQEALGYDATLFAAKNNLAIAQALQGDYSLPIVPLNDEEKATIYYNIGVIAARRGDADAARGLFSLAVETHPRHFPAAADSLAALEKNVVN